MGSIVKALSCICSCEILGDCSKGCLVVAGRGKPSFRMGWGRVGGDENEDSLAESLVCEERGAGGGCEIQEGLCCF